MADGVSFLNAVQYGCAGNGVTDDGPEINNMLAALPPQGGTLFFPAGDYLINTPVVVPSGYSANHSIVAHFLGEGGVVATHEPNDTIYNRVIAPTRFRAGPGLGSAPMIDCRVNGVDNDGSIWPTFTGSFRNIGFLAPASSGTGSALRFNGFIGGTIAECHFQDWGTRAGIHVNGEAFYSAWDRIVCMNSQVVFRSYINNMPISRSVFMNMGGDNPAFNMLGDQAARFNLSGLNVVFREVWFETNDSTAFYCARPRSVEFHACYWERTSQSFAKPVNHIISSGSPGSAQTSVSFFGGYCWNSVSQPFLQLDGQSCYVKANSMEYGGSGNTTFLQADSDNNALEMANIARALANSVTLTTTNRAGLAQLDIGNNLDGHLVGPGT